jgi:hypothetical protein
LSLDISFLSLDFSLNCYIFPENAERVCLERALKKDHTPLNPN